jgi:formylglycine-generating enzyme required for sulfatase activity
MALLLGMAAAAQTPQDAKQRGFKVEEKPEDTLSRQAGLKERYALLIGISKYANPALNLSFAAADAQSLSKVLLDPEVGAYKPENVRLLVDEQATRRNVASALTTWLGNRVTADDSVLIFYSGHGALGNAGEAYWVTYDADPEDLASSALSNKEIVSAIASLPAKRKITLIDSCFSEATAKRYRALVPTNVFDQFRGTGVVTITASTGQQKSVEVSGHGAFTYHLLDALRGKADTNDNGVVELDEIWTYLNERVQKTAADAGNRQTPVLMAERMEHGFPVTVNPARSAEPILASLKQMYTDGQITLEEMADAEKLFAQRETGAELRNLYKGLAEKQINVHYFRQIRNVLSAGTAASASGPPDATRTAGPTAPLPGTASVGEQAAYDLARQVDHETTWQQFLVMYPGSTHAQEAGRRIADLRQRRENELDAFRLADSIADESAWGRFLTEFPAGQFAVIAEERLEALKKVAREREDTAFAQAIRINNLEEWDRFIQQYAASRYAADATKRRAELAKRLDEDNKAAKAENDAFTGAAKGDSVTSWSAYLAKYPDSPHAAEAKKRAERAKWIEFADVVSVPGGSFSMGSEAERDSVPVHRVEVDGLLMGRSEVTNAQYGTFLTETNYRRPPDPSFLIGYSSMPELPVLNVTWDDAMAFCSWLGQKIGANVRLPTEAEWEYAASGGRPGMKYPWGDEPPRTRARYKDNVPSGAKTGTATLFPPTAFGLLNMAGNAAEWIMDYYSSSYYGASTAKNPTGPATGRDRVVRGGSWISAEDEILVALRNKQNPSEASEQIGFRIGIESVRK